jgi:N-dimethylarginine dimethylaminohydrolase
MMAEDRGDEARIAAASFGGQSLTGRLRRVMVRRPARPQTAQDWRRSGYRHPVDHERAEREHARLTALLESEGIEVIAALPDEAGQLDAIFPFDPSLITDAGAILLNMGKREREGEPAAHAVTYGQLGIPVAAALTGEAQAEGGDTFWLDERTLAVGRGYRTNQEGIDQLAGFLEPLGVRVLAWDLPHWTGPGGCLHLLSLISPIGPRVALAHKPLMAVALLRELDARGWQLIDLPAGEYDSLGCNVLCLGQGRLLAVNGNPETRRLLERAGYTVLTYDGDEISHNRAGGPTCLTRPILRDPLPDA